ncbi:MAG TPA: hypothetical protein VGB26_02160 [Nitrospiria bacterium]|jgi:hypothetical protein
MDKKLGRFETYLGWSVLMVFLLVLPGIALSKSISNGQEYVFKAVDYGFEGPDMIPSGWTRIKILNEGKDLHHVQIIRLEDGKARKILLRPLGKIRRFFLLGHNLQGSQTVLFQGKGGLCHCLFKTWPFYGDLFDSNRKRCPPGGFRNGKTLCRYQKPPPSEISKEKRGIRNSNRGLSV